MDRLTCLRFLSHSFRAAPPSLQCGKSEGVSTRALLFLWPLPFFVSDSAHASFSTHESHIAEAVLFGTKGNVKSNRGGFSGVMTTKLRQMGQSTDSCQQPQSLCKRENDHLRMHMAQNVWPHCPAAFSENGDAIMS